MPISRAYLNHFCFFSSATKERGERIQLVAEIQLGGEMKSNENHDVEARCDMIRRIVA